MYCTRCGTYNDDRNGFCTSCGAQMVDITARAPPINISSGIQKSAGIAVLLALIIPGAGQIYAERIFRGIVVLIITLLTIWFLVGLITWVYGMIDSYYLVQRWNKEVMDHPYDRPW